MLNKRLSGMGEVNPLAAQEYDEINQEYAFLQKQQQDLENSIADLHTTIERLNKTTKSRFLAAFEEVRSAFSDIFGRLFQGGEARMFLLDPNDPLETGVDIEVRPPGKRPSNIMLLSAGREGAHRYFAVVRGIQRSAESVLHPRRGGCYPGRCECRTFPRGVGRTRGSEPVYHHHP